MTVTEFMRSAFEPGDPICQPPGPTAWTPTAFRARYFGQLPSLMAGAAYEANNFGATSVGAAFSVSGTGPGKTIAEIEKTQNDGLMPWSAGLSINAATSYLPKDLPNPPIYSDSPGPARICCTSS